MKKFAKIVLITILITLPALGTYVKTALPNIGSATDLTMENTAERTETGYCQEPGVAVSIDCIHAGKRSEFADPLMGGIPGREPESRQDFPVNFLWKAIPFQEKVPGQNNVEEMKGQGYLTAFML